MTSCRYLPWSISNLRGFEKTAESSPQVNHFYPVDNPVWSKRVKSLKQKYEIHNEMVTEG